MERESFSHSPDKSEAKNKIAELKYKTYMKVVNSFKLISFSQLILLFSKGPYLSLIELSVNKIEFWHTPCILVSTAQSKIERHMTSIFAIFGFRKSSYSRHIWSSLGNSTYQTVMF